MNPTPSPETESDSQINITCHSCLILSLQEKQSSLQADRSPLHRRMTFTGVTVLLIGFVVGCSNNSLCNTTSAVHCQPNYLIQWVFGSFVSRVWDTLVCGCLWESCHCPVLRDYAHVGPTLTAGLLPLQHSTKIVFYGRFTVLHFIEVCCFFFYKNNSPANVVSTTACFVGIIQSENGVCGTYERASNCIPHWPCSVLHINKMLITAHKAEKDWVLWNPETPLRVGFQSRRIKKAVSSWNIKRTLYHRHTLPFFTFHSQFLKMSLAIPCNHSQR